MTLIEIVCTAIGVLITVSFGAYYMYDEIQNRKAPKDSYGEVSPILGVVLPKNEANKKDNK
jgi:hypothetical protein